MTATANAYINTETVGDGNAQARTAAGTHRMSDHQGKLGPGEAAPANSANASSHAFSPGYNVTSPRLSKPTDSGSCIINPSQPY